MVSALLIAVQILLIPAALLAVAELCYIPLALWSRLREGKRPHLHGRRNPHFGVHNPLVSVIVPAYNEGVVLARCVESILADRYRHKEIILVDDGSSDDTWEVMQRFHGLPRMTLLRQKNSGKAVALNNGIDHALGQILMFVDADGVFSSHTVSAMLAGFGDPKVGAVCGNDAPVNLNRLQPQLLTLLTHVTALVRRALSTVNCLTIVSGNCGAVRRDVLNVIGGFTPGLLGEDLELTWRVRKAGFKVAFQPHALVFAEVPASARSLWQQRVRWARGYLQTAKLHRTMLGNPRYGVVGPYLAFNMISMVVAPILQMLALVLLVIIAACGGSSAFGLPVTILSWVLLVLPLISVTIAAALDGSLKDLRFIYILLAMPVYSLAMNLVLVTALVQELRNAPSRWNKFSRSGVSSRDGVPASASS